MADGESLTLHVYISVTRRINVVFNSEGHAKAYLTYLSTHCHELDPKQVRNSVSVDFPRAITRITFENERKLGFMFSSADEADYWRNMLKFWHPKSRHAPETLLFRRRWSKKELEQELSRDTAKIGQTKPSGREMRQAFYGDSTHAQHSSTAPTRRAMAKVISIFDRSRDNKNEKEKKRKGKEKKGKGKKRKRKEKKRPNGLRRVIANIIGRR
ncbi:hypothetical protein F4820DRAFT_413784 [Hypoxylon rubiginosum]|uniref:Uncharacterized protein n=1 Tax=Hypoxylon rubiginosum TaxID=110542 RepID=A0ACB9Z7T8_9PEZI|nr:hypothetical protein F4820DRAFT_413784 [Hypoxylon rubiginosum]